MTTEAEKPKTPEAPATPPVPPAPETKPDLPGKDPPKDPPATAKASELPPSEEVDIDLVVKEGGTLPAMPAKAFLTRVKRATKQQLMDLFGTDDKEAILQWKRDYDAMAKSREEQNRAAMTEKERLETDLAKAQSDAAAVRQEFDSYKEEQEYNRADTTVTRLASKYIDEEALDYVAMKFAKHVLTLDAKDPDDKKMLRAYRKDPEAVTAWMKDYAEKHPKFAKDAPAPKAKKEEKKEPITTAPKGGEKPPPAKGDGNGGKTIKPGQPNSMTYQEVAAATGRSWR